MFKNKDNFEYCVVGMYRNRCTCSLLLGGFPLLDKRTQLSESKELVGFIEPKQLRANKQLC